MSEYGSVIAQLEEAQLRIRDRRESLLREGAIGETPTVRTIEATKRILKHLDGCAAAVAGAHVRIRLWEKDTIFSESEKYAMLWLTMKRLNTDMKQPLKADTNMLPAVKDCYSFLERHHGLPYEIDEPISRFITEELMQKRQIASETLDQLEQLEREVDEILRLLVASIDESVGHLHDSWTWVTQ